MPEPVAAKAVCLYRSCLIMLYAPVCGCTLPWLRLRASPRRVVDWTQDRSESVHPVRTCHPARRYLDRVLRPMIFFLGVELDIII